MSTRPTTPEGYIDSLPEPRRTEIARIHSFIRKTVPRLETGMQGGMIGYGPFHYRYASGREGDTFKIGLASRAASISIYACAVVDGKYVAERYRRELGKASVGKSCIRFKRFEDLDHAVLKRVLREAAKGSFGV